MTTQIESLRLVLDEMRRLARLANVDHTENKGVVALEQVITLAEQPAQQEQHEFPLRGVLASELKCWHRLTEEEVDNLLAFVKRAAPQPAQRKPLTLREIGAICGNFSNETFKIVRQTEAAHGIKENT